MRPTCNSQSKFEAADWMATKLVSAILSFSLGVTAQSKLYVYLHIGLSADFITYNNGISCLKFIDLYILQIKKMILLLEFYELGNRNVRTSLRFEFLGGCYTFSYRSEHIDS